MSLAYNPNATIENVLPQAKKMKEMLISMKESIFIQQQQITMPRMITDSENVKVATEWSIQSNRATIAQAMFELMTTDLRTGVEKVTIPILILGSWYGAKDYGITKESIKIKYQNQFYKAKNYKIIIAETAKHFIMWDQPKWFLNTVETFIKNEE